MRVPLPGRIGIALLVFVIAVTAINVADPAVPAGSPDDALIAVDELPVGFDAVPGPVEPMLLCGTKIADISSEVGPRSVTGRLFVASPQDGTTASYEEQLLSFRPGDGAPFAVQLQAGASCPAGVFKRADGMAVHGTVTPLVLQGVSGEVSAFQLTGKGWGRKLRHRDSRIDQVVIRRGDHIGILTYSCYGFFFDEGVRNRLAHQFADRLAALP